jgi:hypothetical protein
MCDAQSSNDLEDCSRDPAVDPSATSSLPCFHIAKPSPKKGPSSTTKKANKNSTRNRSTITMAGIGSPRSHPGAEFSSPLIYQTKREPTCLDVPNNPAGYRKLLPTLRFSASCTPILSCKRPATSCAIPPANLASRSGGVATRNPPAHAPPPPRNIRGINFFHDRNQMTAPTVQLHVRQFVLNLFRLVANLLLYAYPSAFSFGFERAILNLRHADS